MSSQYAKLWSSFFPYESAFHPQDPRLNLVESLRSFLTDGEGKNFYLSRVMNDSTKAFNRTVYFDIQELRDILPFADVEHAIIQNPVEFSSCFSLSLSSIVNENLPYLDEPVLLIAAFYNLTRCIGFGDVNAENVLRLVSLEGHVLRASQSRLYVTRGAFKCPKCKQYSFRSFEDGIYDPPMVCATSKCFNKLLEFDRNNSSMALYQRLRISEINKPGNNIDEEVARVPRYLDIELREPLVNSCIPGDYVRIVGIVKAAQLELSRWANKGNRGNGSMRAESGLHELYVLAQSIVCLKSSTDETAAINSSGVLLNKEVGKEGSSASGSGNRRGQVDFTASELQDIRDLAMTGRALSILISNLCPTIYGQEMVKMGLVLALFGGSQYPNDTAHDKDFKIRTNIHVLMVGDPGVGKSQLLRACAAVAPRAVLAGASTSTTAGLTVAVSRDSGGSGSRQGGDLCIEAGALVLADQGICCIDELDKISCDQHALLEAMEQQSISIAKGGVVASLRCHTAVFAAANPVSGKYSKRKSVCENLKMNAALLSRFDLVFILIDRPDEYEDRMVGEHIASRHGPEGMAFRGGGASSHSVPMVTLIDNEESGTEALSLKQRLRRETEFVSAAQARGEAVSRQSVAQIRRYIEYAKHYAQPALTPPAAKVLQKLYLTMRAGSGGGDGKNSLPVTTRHLESLIRLAQARARLDLRDEVTEEDALDVVNLLQESLLDVLTSESGEIEHSRKGGISIAKQMKALVRVMAKESEMRGSNLFQRSEIALLAQRMKLDKEVDALIELMRTECYLLLKGPKLYQLQSSF